MVYMPHWPQLFGQAELVPGTARIKELLGRLGNPHLHMPPVVHVAGTNGKGSVIAFLKTILSAAGYDVHAYTSPHLLQFNERIILAGDKVQDNVLYTALEACRIAADGMPLTFFEGTTAAAFRLFSEHPADVLLIETGMGGRLDPTNIIENPIATVITPISLDHQEYLGPDIGSIAAEKAGITKENVPCIIAPQEQHAMEVLSVMAHKQGARLFRYGYEWNVAFQEDKAKGLQLVTDNAQMTFPYPELAGMHQITNAATAVATIGQIKDYFEIPQRAIDKGITEAIWPARLQPLQGKIRQLLPQNWELWLDGGHNEAAAIALSEWLIPYYGQPIYLLFGTSRGKNMQVFLEKFKEIKPHILAYKVKSEPDSYHAEEVASVADALGLSNTMVDGFEEAIEFIKKDTAEPGVILACGSLFLAKDWEREEKIQPSVLEKV